MYPDKNTRKKELIKTCINFTYNFLKIRSKKNIRFRGQVKHRF